MRLSIFLPAFLIPALSLANSCNRDDPGHCLGPSDATYLVNSFASLLTDFKVSVANETLANDFTDTSDSINWLAGIPLGSTTFPTRAAFIAGQGSEPPIGFDVLSIDAVTCHVIAFRWVASVASQKFPVKGINILHATRCSGEWKIDTVFSEFNSAAWVSDIGGTCSVPSS
jgi:hypothetical protein